MKHNLCICTGAYKRPELLELFCRYYAWLQKRIPFTLIVACSESSARQIVEHYGHTAFMVNNHPLTRKFNMAAQYAEGADYCINIGSDDFLTEKTLRHYCTLFDRGIDYIAPLDWWFYNSLTGKSIYWAGYNKPENVGKPCGAGRALSKRLLEAMDWRPWADGYDHILDTGMDVNLAKHPHTSHIFSLNQIQLFALDIKTAVNMTPYNDWPNTIPMNTNDMLQKHFPEWKDEILKL